MFLLFVNKLRLALLLFLESNNNGSNRWRILQQPVSSTVMYIHPNASILATGCFTTCPRLLTNILWFAREHSLKCLTTFLGMFWDIPWNFLQHSPEYLRTFHRNFADIPRSSIVNEAIRAILSLFLFFSFFFFLFFYKKISHTQKS